MKFKFAERGQALILVALGAIGLFAMTGLAIDGSAKFSDRRHAQNAADTAALAGAIGLARGDSGWQIDALDRARDNGYNDNLVTNKVEVYNPPRTGIYSDCSDVHFDCNDYVQVLITSHVNTYFARVIGINQTHNYVEAVASKISSRSDFNFGGNAVVALRPDGCALTAIGGSQVTINGGGLYSNSDDSTCSFHGGTCSSLLDVNNTNGTQGAITMVGGYTYGSGCAPQATIQPASSKQIPFPPPYDEMAEPAECLTPGGRTTSGGTSTLTPGYFDKIEGGGSWGTNIVLTPGVYCIGTTLRMNASEVIKVSGTFGVTPGVFLYFKPGGYFTFNGGAGVQLWGIRDITSPYNGYLMYVTPNYASGTPVNCFINGHSGDQFMGTIYAPYCNITMNGTSDPSGFWSQVIGYTVKFAGGSNIILNYESGTSPVWSIPLQVGLTK